MGLVVDADRSTVGAPCPMAADLAHPAGFSEPMNWHRSEGQTPTWHPWASRAGDPFGQRATSNIVLTTDDA
ncbi:MAG: hypothetical protein HUU55_18410 [Myxococcales bacterium]|nr:hypothetical protein [Myxococcales bacterium]